MTYPAPLHPIEIRISIGADDREYVLRALEEIMRQFEERKLEEIGLSSGGGGGCHSIDVRLRDVSVEQFHKELEAWRQNEVAERQKEKTAP